MRFAEDERRWAGGARPAGPVAEGGPPGARPAGPVAEGDSSAHPPKSPPSAPPAGGADRAGGAAQDRPPAPPSAGGADPAREAGGPLDEEQAAEVEHDLGDLLAKAEKERDEYLDLARRTKADFENYRKRMAADVQAALKRGKGEMARELIDAVDNMERALESAGEDSDGLTGGVEMVLRGLREALSRNGIEAVEPKGEKFDPNQHEALSTMPVEGAEPGVVVEVVQKGYRLDDQLLRPARVVVSA